MALPDPLFNRLFNWKFGQAVQYLDASVSTEDQKLVRALATRHGNCGWFNGPDAVIVSAALKPILGQFSGWEPAENPDPEE